MQGFSGFLLSIVDFLTHLHFSFLQLIEIAIVVLLGKLTMIVVSRAMARLVRLKKVNRGAQHAIVQIVRYVVWIVAALWVLNILGIDFNLILASSAALLVGIGLGLQQVFSSLIAGLTLLTEGSIRVGDVLKVDGEVVRVTRIGLRTSKVVNRDDIVSIIPNTLLTANKITNWSHERENTRFRLTVGVSYKTDIDRALELIVESAKENPVNAASPAPEGRLLEFGNSSITLELLFWSKENFRIEKALSDIRRSIWKKFQENGIEIPFPQQVVHIEK